MRQKCPLHSLQHKLCHGHKKYLIVGFDCGFKSKLTSLRFWILDSLKVSFLQIAWFIIPPDYEIFYMLLFPKLFQHNMCMPGIYIAILLP